MKDNVLNNDAPVEPTRPEQDRGVEPGAAPNAKTGRQAADPNVRYTFLHDIDPCGVSALSRLEAIAEAMLPERETRDDPFWIEATPVIFAAALAYVLKSETDPSRCTVACVAQRILGIDPTTGKTDPKETLRFFCEIAGGGE
jgi:hypothetical protein